MNDDEKFDSWLIEASRDYNRPPASTPRDEMWQVIAARQQPGHSLGVPSGAPRSWRRMMIVRWVPLAAAAALLVVVSYRLGVSRGAGSSAPAVATTPEAASQGAFYSRATDRHLGRADALLTSLRTSGAGDSLDASLTAWARELLVDTRLLLDSPAAGDATHRRLLEDLELLLAQVVQLSAAATPDDQEMVERKLERGELLTRIRSAVPGTTSGT
jgi:hypothetical protein